MGARAFAIATGLATALLLGGVTSAGTDEPGLSERFAAGMHEAMMRMDAGMAVHGSGDPDRDFAAMMIPHHQGAVDMALLELRYGKDTSLRRLAQEIIVTQRQEIDVMQRSLGALTTPPRSQR
jgi:uncharacterized protein (DUF305 family)